MYKRLAICKQCPLYTRCRNLEYKINDILLPIYPKIVIDAAILVNDIQSIVKINLSESMSISNKIFELAKIMKLEQNILDNEKINNPKRE